MNPLSEVALNSVALIDARLAELQREVSEMEMDYGGDITEEIQPIEIPQPIAQPVEMAETKSETRYQALPAMTQQTKMVRTKPKIDPKYTQTLQYVPDMMNLYDVKEREPEFTQDLVEITPKPKHDPTMLYTHLTNQVFKLL